MQCGIALATDAPGACHGPRAGLPAAARSSHAVWLDGRLRPLDADMASIASERRRVRGLGGGGAHGGRVAARSMMIRGHEFVRHVRTNVEEEAGLRRADAVYTVSPALPDGLRTFDADVADSCAENGIPTI